LTRTQGLGSCWKNGIMEWWNNGFKRGYSSNIRPHPFAPMFQYSSNPIFQEQGDSQDCIVHRDFYH
jgi:hypothetical protein